MRASGAVPGLPGWAAQGLPFQLSTGMSRLNVEFAFNHLLSWSTLPLHWRSTIRFLGTGLASFLVGVALWLVLVGLVVLVDRWLGFFSWPDSEMLSEPVLAALIGPCLLFASWVVASRSWALGGRWASPIVYLAYIFPVTMAEAIENGVNKTFIIAAILGVVGGGFLCFCGGALGDRRRRARQTEPVRTQIEEGQKITIASTETSDGHGNP